MKDFLNEYYPQAIRAFERRESYNYDDLEVGMQLIMLKNGFGGLGGEIRKIIEINDKYVTVTCGRKDSRYLLYKESDRNGPWWLSCYILNSKEMTEMINQRDKYKNIEKLTGIRFGY